MHKLEEVNPTFYKLDKLSKLKAELELPNYSSITVNEKSIVMSWIQGAKSMSLIYKATKDGWLISDFAKLCVEKSNTLMLVESKNGRRFGGYVVPSWVDDNKHKSESTNSSFLYSLDNKTKIPIREYDGYAMLLNSSNNGYIYFGYTDLFIASNSNINSISWSYLGDSYNCEAVGLDYESEDAKCYLAGSYEFEICEIEVYQIKF